MEVLKRNFLWRHSFEEYITGLNWSALENSLAVSTAGGEVAIITDREAEMLQGCDQTIETVAFASNNQWLAAAGQGGKLSLWHWPDRSLIETLDQGNAWIDHLQWHPQIPELAFSLGKYVQIWGESCRDIIHTLNFENSTILALAWHPQGQWLAIGGYQGIKLWPREDWFADPIHLALPAATETISWSPCGQYLAAATMDGIGIIAPWEGGQFADDPWRLQGFPGKISALQWWKTDLLLTCSGKEVVAWQKHPDPEIGWEPSLLEEQAEPISVIDLHPQQRWLAVGSTGGKISLWPTPKKKVQTLKVGSGISSLAWHPHAHNLVAGTREGEVICWAPATTSRAVGFGK